MSKTTPASGLSKMQRDLLVHFWQLYLDQVEHESQPGFPGGCRWADSFGVPYRTNGTPGFRAAISRAVSRLLDRGLVLKQNSTSGSPGIGHCRESKEQAPPLRATRVSFTDLGKAIAQRLSKDVTAVVNR